MKQPSVTPNPERRLFQISHAVIRQQEFTAAPGWLYLLWLMLIGKQSWDDHYTLNVLLRLTRIETDFTDKFGHIGLLDRGDVITIEDGTIWKILDIDYKAWQLEVKNMSIHRACPDTTKWRLRLFHRTATIAKAA